MERPLSEPLKQVSNFDLKLIRVFKAVVESGGFTPASSLLGVSRSAISIHMANLESRLDLTLCQRGRSGFALTQEGKDVYEASQRLLASIEGFRTEVNEFHQTLRGELNIGITDNLVTMPSMRITDALATLKKHGPGVQINIHMAPSDGIERGIIDGRFQVGVLPLINPMRALEYTALYEEISYLYCAADHPLAQPQAMDTQILKHHDAIKPLFPLPIDGYRQQAKLHETATATDREGIVFLILTGQYIGYLPAHFARRWVTRGRLCPIYPEQHQYRIPYAIATRHGRLPNRVLTQFLSSIEKDN